MNVVILAAGTGSRLGNITKTIPKPMLQIKGKPIMEHNILLCKKYGVKRIFINLHYLSEVIIDYFGDGSKYGLDITYSYEKNILGTAGALIPIFNALSKEPFFVIYGDNITNVNMNDLIVYHHKKKSDFTIAIHTKNDISQSGVLEFNELFKVTNFIEKPKSKIITSKWVNAGVYFINPLILKNKIEAGFDFGQDVIPKLIKTHINMFAYKLDTKIVSIDTPELLNIELNNQGGG